LFVVVELLRVEALPLFTVVELLRVDALPLFTVVELREEVLPLFTVVVLLERCGVVEVAEVRLLVVVAARV
jgi:hypothetical protein